MATVKLKAFSRTRERDAKRCSVARKGWVKPWAGNDVLP